MFLPIGPRGIYVLVFNSNDAGLERGDGEGLVLLFAQVGRWHPSVVLDVSTRYRCITQDLHIEKSALVDFVIGYHSGTAVRCVCMCRVGV